MEFALVLPVLLLIVLMAIDFGRALYGWVVLQNSARIAANFAGVNVDGWRSPGNATIVARYQAEIKADLDTANCQPATSTAPDPIFTDGPDTSVSGGPADSSYDVGDTVTVGLSCQFSPITPIIGGIVGDSVTLSARSDFRIRSGDLVGFANPTQIPPPPLPPTPTPTATTSSCAVNASFSRSPNGAIRSGDVVTFTSTSTATGCTIATYAWTFDQASPATSSTSSQAVTFTVPSRQDVDVTLTVTTATGETDAVTQTYDVRP